MGRDNSLQGVCGGGREGMEESVKRGQDCHRILLDPHWSITHPNGDKSLSEQSLTGLYRSMSSSELLKIKISNALTDIRGVLDGGSLMSHVEFKKSPCPVSLFLELPCRF